MDYIFFDMAQLIYKKRENLLIKKGKRPLPIASNSPTKQYSLPPKPLLK